MSYITTLFGFGLGILGTVISTNFIESRKSKQEKIVRQELWLMNHNTETLEAIASCYFAIRDEGINITAIIKSPYNYDPNKERDHLFLFKKLYVKLINFKQDEYIEKLVARFSMNMRNLAYFSQKSLLIL